MGCFSKQSLLFKTKVRINICQSGYWHVADSQSGYTAINNKALNQIDWDQMYKRYGQPNDLPVRLNIYNFKAQDVTIHLYIT